MDSRRIAPVRPAPDFAAGVDRGWNVAGIRSRASAADRSGAGCHPGTDRLARNERQVPGLRVYAQALRDAGTRRDLLMLGAINAVAYLLLSALAHVAGLDHAVVSVQRPNQE